MRTHDQIIVLECEIRNRTYRQIALKRLPILSVVETDVEPVFRSGIQQSFTRAVCPDGSSEVHPVNPVVNAGPGFTIIFRLIDIGREIIQLVPSAYKIGRAGAMRIDFNGIPHHPLRNAARSHIAPVFSLITAHVDQTIVATTPKQASFDGTFSRRKNGAIVFDAGIVFGDGTATRGLSCFIIRSEVGADLLPGPAFILGHEQMIAGGIEALGIMRREEDGVIPLKAISLYIGTGTDSIIWPHINQARLSGSMI